MPTKEPPISPLNPTLRHLLDHCGFDRSFTRGEGVYLWDGAGRKFLDFYAQYGAVALGHNAPVVCQAVQEAFAACEPAMVQPYRAPYAEALAEKLCQLSQLDRCVLASSGAEVVEAAIKLVRARTGRPLILSAEGSYHGKTLGALAATGQPQYSLGFGPPPPGFLRFPFGDAAALARVLEENRGQVAAVLLEPIQGERGVYLPTPGYLAEVRALCTRHQVALILDEIQTGLGRTGYLFAAQHDEVVPDLLLLAKALGGGLFPFAALLISAEFWDDGFALRHSSTFANNNVASRVGLAVLSNLIDGGVIENAAERGAQLQARLRYLAARFPKSVVEVRGRGLLGAIELRARDPRDGFFLGYFSHQGLLAYAAAATLAERSAVLVLPSLGNANVLRIAPPLVISEAEIDLAMDAIESTLSLFENADAASIARSIGATGPRHDPQTKRTAPEPARIALPTPPVVATTRLTYAFIIHYTEKADVVTTDPTFARLSAAELDRYCEFSAGMPSGVVLRAPTVRSKTGAEADGWIIAVPMLPEKMVRSGRRKVSAEIQQAVDLAHSLGAQVVGLGGLTVPYVRRGLDVSGRGPAITTGNTLTALMAVAALDEVALAQGRSLAEQRIAVVGARGSVGGLCARLLAERHPRRLLLIANPDSGVRSLEPLVDELSGATGGLEITTDLGALARCELIISATGSIRPVLDRASIASGTIICDVARPFDASPLLRARPDVTIIDGGLVALPDPTLRFGIGNIAGLPTGVQLACLSETILLALAKVTSHCGVGDAIDLETARMIRRLAERHGFRLSAPLRDGKPLPDRVWKNLLPAPLQGAA